VLIAPAEPADFDGVPSQLARFDGTAWTGLAPASVLGRGVTVIDLDCPAPGRCVGVGYTTDFRAVTTTVDGSIWSARPTPDLRLFERVSCLDAATCVATGPPRDGTARFSSMRGDGTDWVAGAVPGEPPVLVGALSCHVSGCTLVGMTAGAGPVSFHYTR
jgi:hypothetical protein